MADLSISELIDAHRAAIAADEASFDDDGNPIDAEAAEVSLEAEQNAYRAFASAQCRDAVDVVTKVEYLLTGSVGERSTLVDCLTLEEYCDEDGDQMLDVFLQSLVAWRN